MKRFIAILLTACSLGLGGSALAEEKAAAPVAATTAPAAAPSAMSAPPAEVAPAVAPLPSKGDTAWMTVATVLVILMSIPASRCSTAAWCAARTCSRC